MRASTTLFTASPYALRLSGLLLLVLAACSPPIPTGHEQRHAKTPTSVARTVDGDGTSSRGAPQMPCTDKRTFLDTATIEALEAQGWTMFTCSDDDVIFRRTDHIKTPGQFDDPEELGIAKYSQVLPGKIEQIARKFRNPQSAELAAYMIKKFQVGEGRDDLTYSGVLVDGRILASATVFASETTFCEFSFPDGPNPQTTCEKVVGDYLVQLRSHSINYQYLESSLKTISSVVGK